MTNATRRWGTGLPFCLIVIFLPGCAASKNTAAPMSETKAQMSVPRVDFSFEVARVWSGQFVGFDLVTRGNHQCVGYYDHEGRMTLALRTLDANEWAFHHLPEMPNLGWSGHKDIVLEFDDDGYLHVSGNMHGSPLIYFRSTRPHDLQSLVRVPVMVDSSTERKCTYPRFDRGSELGLVFHYRDGSSGSGNEIYNVYNLSTKTWRRLLDTPLIDGEGKRNAYNGVTKGPDGYFHLSWIWRDTPDCTTNHDLSYARSKDLLTWETIDGKPIRLPITYDTAGVVVDPVPVNSGFGGGGLGFDGDGRPILTYIKFDAEGMTQAYNARWEHGGWKIDSAVTTRVFGGSARRGGPHVVC